MAYAKSGQELAKNKAIMAAKTVAPKVVKAPAPKPLSTTSKVVQAAGVPFERAGRAAREVVSTGSKLASAAARNATGGDVRKLTDSWK